MRFVLLHHFGWSGHADHYDLMLQKDVGVSDDSEVLATFSTTTDQPPTGIGEVMAINFDHRRVYLDYEGALKGGRGSVTRVDGGELEWLSTDRSRFRLNGKILQGVYHLDSRPGELRFTRISA